MELPLELQMIINDYARPVSRPDWKKGSYMIRKLTNATCDTEFPDEFAYITHLKYFELCSRYLVPISILPKS
jgi:hypothetical protein